MSDLQSEEVIVLCFFWVVVLITLCFMFLLHGASLSPKE